MSLYFFTWVIPKTQRVLIDKIKRKDRGANFTRREIHELAILLSDAQRFSLGIPAALKR